MGDFKFHIDVSTDDVRIEQRDGTHRIYFRNRGVIDIVRKLVDDLRVYARYRVR
jgi:hypothetical protein